MSDAMRDLPRYKSHKIVQAARIRAIMVNTDDGINTLALEGGESVQVVKGYMRHNPEPGGYYVRYPDGYESWSPAEAFEDGYTLVE